MTEAPIDPQSFGRKPFLTAVLLSYFNMVKLAIVAVAVAALAGEALGHARVTSPKPRAVSLDVP
jgi:hypothetical protein